MRATKVGDSTVADLRKQVRRRTRTDRSRRDNFGRGFALALQDRFGPVLLRGFLDIVIAIFHRIVRFGQRQILKRQAPLRRIQKLDSDSPSRKRRAVHHDPSMRKSHSAISQHNLQIERLQAFMYLFAVIDASFLDPLRNLRLGFGKAADKVSREKPLHPRALHQQVSLRPRPRIPRIPAWIRGGAADYDARANRKISQDSVRNWSGSVVEINMDATRASATQHFVQIDLAFVVDGRVIAEFLQTLARFLGSARYAYRTATLDPGDLSYARANSARRGRNNDGVSSLRRADIEESEIGREAIEPQDAEIQRKRQVARSDLEIDMFVGGCRVFLPPEQAHDLLTN